jgi:hypothetical protein
MMLLCLHVSPRPPAVRPPLLVRPRQCRPPYGHRTRSLYRLWHVARLRRTCHDCLFFLVEVHLLLFVLVCTTCCVVMCWWDTSNLIGRRPLMGLGVLSWAVSSPTHSSPPVFHAPFR